MAIFPRLRLERVVQVDDSTRLDASSSFISKGESAVTLVEIEPSAGDGFVDVMSSNSKNWFLDWQYSGTSETKAVSVRVTTDGVPVVYTENLEVLTVADDHLFSDDKDLIDNEEDILKFLPEQRKSFLNVHRKAQELIVADFDERGVVDTRGRPLTKANFVDIDEVRQWSRDLAMSLIFQDLSNAVGDVFSLKSQFYYSEGLKHKDRAYFRVDKNNDMTIDLGEASPFRTVDLVRR